MRHFIAYHNPERMGYQYTVHEGKQQRILTNKPVEHVLGNIVWVITFREGHNYSLASIFRVTDYGNANESGFRHWISGLGHVFRPWREIRARTWFPNLMNATGNFGLGLQEVSDASVLAGLTELAEQDGYKVQNF